MFLSKYKINSMRSNDKSNSKDMIKQENKFFHIHHIDKEYFNDFKETYAPVFILNTGRSGSAFIENLFKNLDSLQVYHEAQPMLMTFPNFAFHNQVEKEILFKVFEAARTELMLKAFLDGKKYMESNHCLVFFAHQIKRIFPKAKFVHLLRHPGDFTRSAIMKGWHRNDSIWENNRIRMENNEEWSQLNQIEKIAWTWNSTHSFIEDFKSDHPNDVYTVKLEELTKSTEKFKEFCEFININENVDYKKIKSNLNKKVNKIHINDNEPPNMFKIGNYQKYIDWNELDKNLVIKHCSRLAKAYNYTL